MSGYHHLVDPDGCLWRQMPDGRYVLLVPDEPEGIYTLKELTDRWGPVRALEPTQDAQNAPQRPSQPHDGATPPTTPTLSGAGKGPEMPENENASQSALQVREWGTLMGHLQATLVLTRGNAMAAAQTCRIIHAETGHMGGTTPEEYDAQAWAARRLLDQLQGLPAPEVPVDDALGQATLEEALEEEERKRHWVREGGYVFHPLSPHALTSGDEDEVTCLRCLHHLAKARG